MAFLEGINRFLGGACVPLLLFSAGAFFLVLLRGIPAHPRRAFRVLREKTGGRSPLRALFVALAGTLGVGNITGVALAVSLGGAGAVFWMWAGALFAMPLKYAETVLAMAHRKPTPSGARGGMMYVLRDVLPGKPGLVTGGVFAALCLFAAFSMGGMLQSNAASAALSALFGIPPWIPGAFFLCAAAAVLLGGGKRIAAVTEKMVPAFTALYLFVSLVVIAAGAPRLPSVFARIFGGAFSLPAAGGGIAGFGVSAALRQGVSRGLLSNEAGCGTAPMAHASSDASPCRQGLFGVVEVFVDTVVLCTATALVILLAFDPIPRGGGILLAVFAFGQVLGTPASWFVALSVLYFAFGTVLSWGYYAECAVSYFTARPAAHAAVRVLFCLSLLPGALASPDGLFALADLAMALLAVCNVPLLLFCRREIALLSRHLTEPIPRRESRKRPSPSPPT